MLRRFTLLTGGVIATAGCLWVATATAKTENWKDSQGNTFRGEPAEVLGPLALFGLPNMAARLVPWRLLAPDDCVRFYELVRNEPARAADWAQAKSRVSEELSDHVLRVRDGHLVAADLKGRPEPEFLIVFYATNSEGKSWEMMGNDTPRRYAKLQAEYPGMVEALFYGLRHAKFEHVNMAVSMNMPWLVADFAGESRLDTITRRAPAGGFGIAVLSRGGSVVFFSSADNQAAVGHFFDDLAKLLDLLRPDNPQSWRDRAYYLQAVRPVAYATGRAAPELVGDPLDAGALNAGGVRRFEAAIDVAADGRARRVSFIKPEKDLKPEMAQAIGRALLQAVFVPAVDNGKLVDGVYEYQFGGPR